jgi:hypothetical protein
MVQVFYHYGGRSCKGNSEDRGHSYLFRVRTVHEFLNRLSSLHASLDFHLYFLPTQEAFELTLHARVSISDSL